MEPAVETSTFHVSEQANNSVLYNT